MWFKRIGLFLMVNFLIILTVGIVSSLLGVGNYRQGSSLNLPALLGFCVIWGFVGSFISLALSRFMAKKMMGVKVIDPASAGGIEQSLLERVQRLSSAAGLPMPEVGIYDSPEINAFATGPTKKRSLVAVSSGLLRRMNDAEVEGVLAHEVAHIANGDMVTLTLVQGLVNSFVLFFAKIVGFIAGQAVEENKRFMVEIVVSIAAQILFGILGTMVVARFSRAREFRADTGGARLAGRDRMIAALSALQRNVESIDPHTPEAVAAFKISSRPSGFMALFSTHPPLEDRIRALQTQNI
jgi:heat shock protein HtpX